VQRHEHGMMASMGGELVACMKRKGDESCKICNMRRMTRQHFNDEMHAEQNVVRKASCYTRRLQRKCDPSGVCKHA